MTRNGRPSAELSALTLGTTGPSLTVADVSREDFVRYAGASGDFNPLHYDESFANDAGHPTVFAQGMFVAGIASRFLTDWFGVDSVTRFRTRFTAQVWPGDTLTVTGEIIERSTTDDGTEFDIDFAVRNQDDTVVLSGDATAVLPLSD